MRQQIASAEHHGIDRRVAQFTAAAKNAEGGDDAFAVFFKAHFIQQGSVQTFQITGVHKPAAKPGRKRRKRAVRIHALDGAAVFGIGDQQEHVGKYGADEALVLHAQHFGKQRSKCRRAIRHGIVQRNLAAGFGGNLIKLPGPAQKQRRHAFVQTCAGARILPQGAKHL